MGGGVAVEWAFVEALNLGRRARRITTRHSRRLRPSSKLFFEPRNVTEIFLPTRCPFGAEHVPKRQVVHFHAE